MLPDNGNDLLTINYLPSLDFEEAGVMKRSVSIALLFFLSGASLAGAVDLQGFYIGANGGAGFGFKRSIHQRRSCYHSRHPEVPLTPEISNGFLGGVSTSLKPA